MDNFFDLTNESFTNGIQPSLSDLSPSQKRKRKFEEMESELNLNETGIETLVNTEIEVVTPPPLKRQKLGSDEPTLSRLLYSNNFSDIVFQVENKQFHVIKAIFAVKSEKFEEMLFPKSTDPNGHQETVKFIALHDITANAFEFIRDFCYDMPIDLNLQNAVDVLHASKVYDIVKLKQQCIAFLQKIDNVNDLLLILKQIAEKQSHSVLLVNEVGDLLQNNMALLQCNGSELIESEVFPQLPLSMVCKIIENDNLGVKEEDLWSACKQWCHETDLKKMIRFCLMDISFLYDQVKPSGVLSETDLVSIYEKKLGLAADCVFNCNERVIVKKRKRRSAKNKKQEVTNVKETNEEEESKEDGEEQADVEVEEEEEPVTRRRGRSRSSKTKKNEENTPKSKRRSKRGKKK